MHDAARTSLTVLPFDIDDLDQVLSQRALAAPAALAFAGADGERTTYGELHAAAGAMAAALARLGAGAGDRVALLLPAGLGFVRAFFALQRLGAVPFALAPSLPPATAARAAARVRPRLAVATDPALLAGCAAAGLPAVDLAFLDAAARGASAPTAVLLPPPRDAAADAAAASFPLRGRESIAFLQATSGTSGEPRAAVVLQRNALASLAAARQRLGIGPADVLVSWVPPWHDLGLLRFVLGPVYFGAACHLVPPAIHTIPQWLRTAAAVRATVLGAPDFAYRLAARLVDPGGLDLSALRHATNGGEPVRSSTIAAFEGRFGVPGVVRPGYGLAEATLGVTCLAAGEALRCDARGNVSCGRPFPGVEVRIDDAGQILVRGPGVFAGYFDALAGGGSEVLRGGWLHTGDLGALDADGHLYVLGRLRAMLKRGGVPVAPRELEEAAEQVPGVRVAAALGLPAADEAANEDIVLALEADPAWRGPLADLAAAAAAAVAATAGFVPERVLVLAPRAIARTANGKLRHLALRHDLLAATADGGGPILFDSRRPVD